MSSFVSFKSSYNSNAVVRAATLVLMGYAAAIHDAEALRLTIEFEKSDLIIKPSIPKELIILVDLLARPVRRNPATRRRSQISQIRVRAMINKLYSLSPPILRMILSTLTQNLNIIMHVRLLCTSMSVWIPRRTKLASTFSVSPEG
jgi:hypothetical protein